MSALQGTGFITDQECLSGSNTRTEPRPHVNAFELIRTLLSELTPPLLRQGFFIFVMELDNMLTFFPDNVNQVSLMPPNFNAHKATANLKNVSAINLHSHELNYAMIA